MERQHIAYLLILLMILAIGGIVAYLRHNTHERRHQRRRVREQAAHEKRMAERAEGRA